MAMPGRKPTPVDVRTQIKIELLARRGWPLRRISRVLDLSYTAVRRIAARGVPRLRLREALDCPHCGRRTQVAPCPHCGGTTFPPESLAAIDADRGLGTREQSTLDRLRAEKSACRSGGYSPREIEEKYFLLRVARFGHA